MSTTVTASPQQGRAASRRRVSTQGQAHGQAAPRARAETQLEIGSGPGTASGSDAFAGLEAGIIVAALVMAIGSGWGLTRRLAEYR